MAPMLVKQIVVGSLGSEYGGPGLWDGVAPKSVMQVIRKQQQ